MPTTSENTKGKDPPIIIVPADPSIELANQLSTNQVGLVSIALAPGPLLQGGQEYLAQVLKRHNIDPVRSPDEGHILRLDDSFINQGLSMYDSPGHVGIDPRRNAASRFPTTSSAIDFIKARINSKEPLTLEEVEELGVIMFDGRQRFRALERRVQLLGEDSVQLLAWVLVFSDESFDEPLLLEELVHGRNRRNSFPSAVTEPTSFSLLTNVHRVRTGLPVGRLQAITDPKVRNAFHYFATSRSSVELACEALKHSFINEILLGASKTVRIAWISNFRSATSFLYTAVITLVESLNSFDPTGSIIDAELFPFLSQLLRYLSATNPLHLEEYEEHASEEEQTISAATRSDQCFDLGKRILECVEEKVLCGRKFVQLEDVKRWFKGAKGISKMDATVAKRVVTKLKVLAARLQDRAWSKGIVGQFDKELFLSDDFANVSSSTLGSTTILRGIALLQQEFYEPFVRVLLASLQLSSHDDSLDLHEGDWLDLEPVVHALLYPGEADQYLKDPRLNVASSKSWEVGQEFASYFKAFLRSVYKHRRELLVDLYAAKMRLKYRFTPQEREDLFNLAVAEGLRSTPQAAVLKEFLHLLPFAIEGEGKLVPFTHFQQDDRFRLFLQGNAFSLDGFCLAVLPYLAAADQSTLDGQLAKNSGVFREAYCDYNRIFAEDEEDEEDEDEENEEDRRLAHTPDGLERALLSALADDVHNKNISSTVEASLSKLPSFQPVPLTPPAPRTPSRASSSASRASSPDRPRLDGGITRKRPSRSKGQPSQAQKNGPAASTSTSSSSSAPTSEDESAPVKKKKKPSGKPRATVEKGGKRDKDKASASGSNGGTKVGRKKQATAVDQGQGENDETEGDGEAGGGGGATDSENGGSTRSGGSKDLAPQSSDVQIVSIDGQPLLESTSTTMFNDPKRSAVLTSRLLALVVDTKQIAITMFRRSNVYPPVGDSFDSAKFNIDDFKVSFDRWFDGQIRFDSSLLPQAYPPLKHGPAGVLPLALIELHVNSKLLLLSHQGSFVPSNFWYDLTTFIKAEE